MITKRQKILLCIAGTIIIIFSSLWAYNKYDETIFLRYGILHIKKYPQSMKMLYHETWGASDFDAEYYVSIDSKEFNKLLAGHKYIKSNSNRNELLTVAVGPERDTFPVEYCYTAGTLATGLTRVFTNSNHTIVYVVYWVD